VVSEPLVAVEPYDWGPEEPGESLPRLNLKSMEFILLGTSTAHDYMAIHLLGSTIISNNSTKPCESSSKSVLIFYSLV
jgi:hypothetical protein